MGGLAGSVLGGEFGLLGGALGGATGYVLEKIAEKVGDVDLDPVMVGPGIFGSIITDVSDFVGREEELGRIDRFFGGVDRGVCLLHGFGGCGKSALLKFFTDRHRLLEGNGKRGSAPPTFLWSFGQDPSLQHFFAELRRYIEPMLAKGDRDTEGNKGHSYLNIPELLQRSGKRLVVVLDGIESVLVEDGKTEARDGSLAVPALRVLLQAASEGKCGRLRVLITSRVVPPELRRVGSDSLLAIELNKFNLDDGYALLRKKGVKGGRHSLERVVADVSFHAYSIALIGDILRTAFRGDVRQVDQVLQNDVAVGKPLQRILQWYQAKLSMRELAYLQAVSLFRTPITRRQVGALLPHVLDECVGEGSVGTGANRLLAAPLEEYGLLFAAYDRDGGDWKVTLHPIIREYFYEQIVNPAGFHRKAYRIVEANLPEQADIADEAQLLLLQELVFQALGSGDVELAWKVYQDRIGGYPMLGYTMADHPSGTKLIDMFFRHADSMIARLPTDVVYDLHVDASLYLKNEGRLDDSIAIFSGLEFIEGRLRKDDAGDAPVSAILVLAGIEVLRGNVRSSERAIRRARGILSGLSLSLPRATEDRLDKEFLTRSAVLDVIRGRDGLSKFVTAAETPFGEGVVPHDFGPIRHVWSLALHGNFEEAELRALSAIEFAKDIGANMLAQRVSIMAAISASWAGDFERADRWSSAVSEWALRADIHVTVLSWLQRGILALRQGKLDVADGILTDGVKFAGDSGFLLEWLDMQAARAFIALSQGRPADAEEIAVAICSGSRDEYLVPLNGAASMEVRYLWPLAVSYQVMKHLCRVEKLDVGDKDLEGSEEFRSVLESENFLINAVGSL